MGGKWVRWNVLKMACHRMGAIIGHPRTFSNGHDTFWAEPELDSFQVIVFSSQMLNTFHSAHSVRPNTPGRDTVVYF